MSDFLSGQRRHCMGAAKGCHALSLAGNSGQPWSRQGSDKERSVDTVSPELGWQHMANSLPWEAWQK